MPKDILPTQSTSPERSSADILGIAKDGTTPFASAEDAWFWFVAAQKAKEDGARVTAGLALIPRPCEPIDILKSLDRLYRNRQLIWDHMLVLKHYGQREYAPDKRRPKEIKSYHLWHDALSKLEQVLVRKGIVLKPSRLSKKDNFTASSNTRKILELERV